ncbi:MAG TPA: proton-conducting transporter membrane subunit [Xanthomonadaceae bacterium]|nr:proton-conducting transporter membrane subunit [Xanthomonadaceae bacterium]
MIELAGIAMNVVAAVVLLVFLPLLAACALLLLPARAHRLVVVVCIAAPLALMLSPTMQVATEGSLDIVLGGYAAPLGIGLHLDSLALLMLWLVAVVGGLAALHALAGFAPGSPAGRRFWPCWLLLIAGLNAMFLSADLFNLYVAFEMVTLMAVALVAIEGSAGALRAALRYLLLGLLASLAYLIGVAILYSAHGTLDLYLLADAVGAGDDATLTAAALITVALLLKGAIFPLHLWLPAAHARAPGPVSALLSALVVKVALYLLWRLWFWTGAGLDLRGAAQVLGTLGATAVLYGAMAALVQSRLKTMVAYSTVAQLGYLMLLLPLADALAFKGAVYHLLSHALAKAAMFLAAANILFALGHDRLDRLGGVDRRLPVSLFAFGIAGVSLMGLPPSGGFLAKWMLLEAALAQRAWGWAAVLILGSLLAAVYVFRVLAAAFRHDDAAPVAAKPVPWLMNASALLLALLALFAGFAAAPVLALLDSGGPFLPLEGP